MHLKNSWPQVSVQVEGKVLLWRWNDFKLLIMLFVEIGRYGFFGADTNTSAIKTSKIRIYELKFFKLQQFQYFATIFNWCD